MFAIKANLQTALCLLLSILSSQVEAEVIVSEVAYKGSPDQCNGEDWVEIFNDGTAEVNLLNYTLHDDKGKDDEDAKLLPEIRVAPGEFLLLCNSVDFDFGIGRSDVITLLNSNGQLISEVALTGEGEDTSTYAYFDGEYKYTATPTPGSSNTFTAQQTLEDKLDKQNALGDDFFLANAAPGESSEFFGPVVVIDIIMDTINLREIQDHPAWSNYVPFNQFTVRTADFTADYVVSAGTGEIRTKGASTLTKVACFGFQNVPFSLKFDTPFLGMERVYLRSHLNDASYMREYASHLLLKRFGLPYLRCRPALLYINGAFIGFYTLMEAPNQDYVMQRSFGAFDQDRTGLFKMKSRVFDCPSTFTPFELADARAAPLPDPFYFKRGSHRNDIPKGSPEECDRFFLNEIIRKREDVIRGYVEYNETCGLALVEMGRVDRDFGPKELELSMIDFLDTKLLNDTVTDLTGSIDADQWIKNFAVYAVMMNFDSPMTDINNWYLATTSGGVNDWRIVQYDHNDIATKHGAKICSFQCSPRQVYWPILRPNCGAVEAHPLVGRILNDQGNMDKYLNYVKEYIEIVKSSLEDLRIYGEGIKDFITNDPLYGIANDGSSLEFVDTYEIRELGPDFKDYNTAETPFLKILEARIVEVQSQLDAIQANKLPRDGSYGTYEGCPDWRDRNGDDYLLFNSFVEGPGCFAECSPATLCFNHDEDVCSTDGDLVGQCRLANLCKRCFPFSRCGLNELEEDKSGEYVESEECNANFCNGFSRCFDHKSGACAFDGEILDEECREAESRCKPCFPESRCATISPTAAPSEMPEIPVDDSTTDDVPEASSTSLHVFFVTKVIVPLLCLLTV